MSIAEDLVKLHQLHQGGGLTEAEFALAKARVLAECPANANAQAGRRDAAFANGSAAGPARHTSWPHSARVAVIVLGIVIAFLAAPVVYSAFENWVLSNTQWNFVRE
jgi:hypothetical protein